MHQGIKMRIEKLEAAHQPPGPTWTIGVDIVEWRGGDNGFGRVLASIPARPLEPGEPFDYRRCIDELIAALDGIDDSAVDWGNADIIEEDREEDDDTEL